MASAQITVRLDMSTCEPDGIVSSLKERWNVREFWKQEVVSLEMSLERFRGDDFYAICNNDLNAADRRRCIDRKNSIRSSAERCLVVARRRFNESR